MRLLKFDRLFSRRKFLGDAARGVLSTGVLMPLWQAIAQTGEITKAYPEELLSLSSYTRGKINVGDEIGANNVEYVKSLLDPVRYEQIVKMGRKLRVAETTTDVLRLSPWDYFHATLSNAGKARFDDRGNVVAPDGRPWLGGNPFPDPKSGLELFASQTLSWGRHDASFYAFHESDVGPDGDVQFEYAGGWAELTPVARVSMDPRPYWPGHEDKLRYQSVFFTNPNSSRGDSFLNVWPYDQNQFPELYGYVREFKRIRQFPTDQRFEPLVPGSAMYLSDAWAAGDPLYTWGEYTIVGRGPFLAAVSGGWNSAHPNWEHSTHGGRAGKTFWDTTVELVPEAIIVDAKPVRFPRAPVSRKRVWFDARNQIVVGMMSYDRRGEPYRSFDGAYSLYESADRRFMDGAHPYWSWTHVHASDIQTGRVSRLEQVRQIENTHFSGANDPHMYERYLTQSALIHLGSS
jgi:hypothetical protein